MLWATQNNGKSPHFALDCSLQTASPVLFLGVMRQKLTPKFLDGLKPASGKRYEVRDTLLIGLLIRVSSRGGKVWYATPRLNGRPKRVKIGNYPKVSLADA